jgi:hypothetical protein
MVNTEPAGEPMGENQKEIPEMAALTVKVRAEVDHPRCISPAWPDTPRGDPLIVE